ncbi:type II secretion system F family protein [Nocardioides sp. zg-1228]|uniref:type II secretion system F family protein n=1 Tax=Nocardioides sp. zg-1228 TaxID=2763008 RepID=UPI0016431AE8|nr:type II secretion system F family protein [Nocardioides sp. zg-1228]MBC2933476.1 type II secretion system F family protein [Nocardioides sp. zg-1228]QSF56384.1 type II secretion system F family protein [Nocardioides sp. zg-1228]
MATTISGALVALAVATPAHATNEINIDHFQARSGSVSMLVSADGLPEGTVADEKSLSVTVDGNPVEASVDTAASGEIERSTVLVVDTSMSMSKGDKYDAAVAAVNAYLEATPAEIAVGLVTFAGKVKEQIAPSTDRAAVLAAVQGAKLTRGTSVYDAIDAASELVGTDGARSLLVLSDGADTNSSTTLAVASNDATNAGVVVDVVALQGSGRAAEISTLADKTGGRVIPADPDALSSVLVEQGDALAGQLLVEFEIPQGVSGEASVDVTVSASDLSYSDSAYVDLGAAPAIGAPDVVKSSKALVSTPVMLLGALALFLGLGGVLSVALTGPRGPSTAEARLDSYFAGTDPQSGASRRKRRAHTEAASLRQSALAVADKVVNADLETRIAQRLTGAGSALTASEWVLLHAGMAVGGSAVGFLMGGAVLGILGLITGTVVPWIYLKWRHRRRLNAFNGQLAQTLGLMAGGLQAGLSLPQAVDTVVREGHEPMAGELRRALVEQRLGVDITDALTSVGTRMDSDDFGWVVMAIRIQREVGGNLAEILHTVSDTLREREYLRRQVKALSAEGRLSGYILVGLPPLIFVYMLFSNRDYISVLYTTGLGYALLAAAVVLLGIGSWAMSKLATVKV